MKVVLLANASSTHTVRWSNSLSESVNLHLISFEEPIDPLKKRVNFHRLHGHFKFRYFFGVFQTLRILNQIKPDIVHAHYASGYGTLGRLCGVYPLIISVWGSDVYEFPMRSWIHRLTLERNLSYAKAILSTSYSMAKEVEKYSGDTPVYVIPFGVDVENFFDFGLRRHCSQVIRLGTLRVQSMNYGIDILLNSFAYLLTHEILEYQVELVVGGDGPEKESFIELAAKLGLEDRVKFLGQIDYSTVPDFLNTIDIFIALSQRESFGVAILEASATGCSVVVTDCDGLLEVVEGGITGFVVPRNDIKSAAISITTLIKSPALRAKMGEAGKAFVQRKYKWSESIQKCLDIYRIVR